MKTLHYSIITVFLGFTGLMISCDNSVYGIWVPQSPQELLNDSTTIFVGNIASVNILHFAKAQLSTMEENGTDKNIVRNYTLNLDEYKVDIEEFLKNPQNANKITVRQPITSWSPGMLGGLDEFHVGDRVLFYVKNLDGNNTYSPESFIIPKFCVAKDVLTQKKLEARGESFTIQNGVKVDNNFTANHPVYFVDNENDYTLSGKSFDTLVSITKITGSSPEIVLSKEIHSEAKLCEWIASSEWEFTPQKGEYRMDVTIKQDNKTYAQYNGKFFVKPDVVTSDYVSPLKQFKSGIGAKDVQCNNGLSLVIKAEDNSPACVKPETVSKLVERGWALDQVQQKSENIATNSSSALKLSLSTNSTIIQSGRAIGITLSLDNTSPSLLNLNSQNNWPIRGLDPGGCSYLPMGIAILDGYYTAQNMSDGHPIPLHFLYPCPPSLPVKTFTFQPMSSNITMTCEPGDWASCQYLTQTKTSVAYSSFLQDGQFFDFNPGHYTLVAGDEWGDVTIQHFQVVNSTQTYTPISNDTENKTVKVVEIKMIPPYTPGGPVIQLTIQNIGTTPITHLNAILETNQNYTFNFQSVTSSTPLISGNSISDTTMLVGGGFQTESTYSLIISGIKDNMPFGYIEKVHIKG